MTRHQKIIAFEGIDGSGKSTAVERLLNDLNQAGRVATRHKWHDRQYARDIIADFTSAGRRTPDLVSGILAMSFMANVNEATSLGSDFLVFDRFYHTGMVKDRHRGVPIELSDKLYKASPVPDLIFYMKVRPDEALRRIKTTRKLNLFETGLQNRFGSHALSVVSEFDSDRIDEDTLDALFLREKTGDVGFYENLFGRCHNVVEVDTHMPQEDVFSAISDEIKSRFDVAV